MWNEIESNWMFYYENLKTFSYSNFTGYLLDDVMKTINNDLDEEKRFYDFLKVSFWIISEFWWNLKHVSKLVY